MTEIYEPERVGRCLAWAGDHYVYEYGESEVIKFSKFDFFLGREKAREKTATDHETCARLFGMYLLPTRIARSEDGRKNALIQEKIRGEYLTPVHLANPTIRHQYRELMAAYRRGLAEGYPHVDLIGGKGAFRIAMTNVFVTPDCRLIFFDALLLGPRDFPWYWRPLFWPIFAIARILQSRTIGIFERAAHHYEIRRP